MLMRGYVKDVDILPAIEVLVGYTHFLRVKATVPRRTIHFCPFGHLATPTLAILMMCSPVFEESGQMLSPPVPISRSSSQSRRGASSSAGGSAASARSASRYASETPVSVKRKAEEYANWLAQQ